MLGNCSCLCCCLLNLFKIFFQECQAVWVQIRTGILKGQQKLPLHCSKERVKAISKLLVFLLNKHFSCVLIGSSLNLYLLFMPFNTFANRADPGQAALVRAG